MANMAYEIQYSNGERDGGYTSYSAAKAAVEERLGPDGEIGHSGDLSDGGDATLFWASEEESENDDGAHAAGKIIAITSDDDDDTDAEMAP